MTIEGASRLQVKNHLLNYVHSRILGDIECEIEDLNTDAKAITTLYNREALQAMHTEVFRELKDLYPGKEVILSQPDAQLLGELTRKICDIATSLSSYIDTMLQHNPTNASFALNVALAYYTVLLNEDGKADLTLEDTVGFNEITKISKDFGTKLKNLVLKELDLRERLASSISAAYLRNSQAISIDDYEIIVPEQNSLTQTEEQLKEDFLSFCYALLELAQEAYPKQISPQQLSQATTEFISEFSLELDDELSELIETASCFAITMNCTMSQLVEDQSEDIDELVQDCIDHCFFEGIVEESERISLEDLENKLVYHNAGHPKDNQRLVAAIAKIHRMKPVLERIAKAEVLAEDNKVFAWSKPQSSVAETHQTPRDSH